MVTDNRLPEFPRHIMHLTTMQEINLASNWIQTIPRDFLFSNMAMCVPPHVPTWPTPRTVPGSLPPMRKAVR